MLDLLPETVSALVVETAIQEAITLCVSRQQIMYVYQCTSHVGIYDGIMSDKQYFLLLYVADPSIERLGDT